MEWIFVVLIVMGVLFAIKLLYVLATVSAHPITQGAMFVPTANIRVTTFLDAVPMRSGDLLVDIGCGDGRVLRAARRRYGVRALGFEVNLLAYLIARVRSLGIEGIQIRLRNFWKVHLGDANVVFCYLFPDVMRRLAKKLEAELYTGTQVVSCNFPIPGWKPLEVLFPDSSLHNDPIYVYRFPESCRSIRTNGKETVQLPGG